MQPTWQNSTGTIRLYRADCRDVLPLAQPVETCLTDPPYDLTANKRGGSGTTLEACYELHRPFIGIEREASYFDDVVSRAKEITSRYGLLETA